MFMSLIMMFMGIKADAAQTEIPSVVELTVMTFNVRRSDLYGWDTPESSWYNVEAVDGYNETHGPHWVLMERGDAAAQSILDSGADIVGLQEYEHEQTKDGWRFSPVPLRRRSHAGC